MRHRKTLTRRVVFVLVCALLAGPPALARPAGPQAKQLTPQQQLLRDIFKELIEIDTTDAHGDTARAARAMAARLLAAGFTDRDVRVLVPAGNAKKGNLVARYRSANPKRKPLLLLAHIDVVEARREDWSTDPFKLVEQDGYYYGRGTTDDKAMAAIFVANLIRLRRENYRPDRDIILALTTDEETGDFNGAEWLTKEHRELVDAEFGINEGGNGQKKNGRPVLNGVQASEKVYQSYQLEVKNSGGHSSLPTKENAIYRLAAGLGRLAAFDFPVNLNEVTRAFFTRTAALESDRQVAADMLAVAQASPDPGAVARLAATPYYNALMRTTCVATRLDAGHAENALPQTARATVNCRILPQERADDVRQALVRVLADGQIKVTPLAESKPSPPSPLTPEVLGPIERVTRELWPGIPVVPLMGTGATDSLFFRQAGINMYGVSGIFHEVGDNRAHGRDERIGIKEFYDGQEFLYRLVNSLTGAPTGG